MSLEKYIYVVIVLFTIACNRIKTYNVNSNTNYDIEILYRNNISDSSNYTNKRCPDGILPMVFEYDLKNDYIEVFVNGELFFNDSLSSSETGATCCLIELGKYKDINIIGIRINNGNIAYAETRNECHLIGVRFIHNKLTVIFYDKYPAYD